MLYEIVKNIALKVIPKSLIVGQEQFFRKLIFNFYKGSSFQCPVCEKKLRAFIGLNVGDKLCPYCGSPARHRRLWTLLQPLLRDKVYVLDFSPPRCLFRKMKELPHIGYTPTDFVGEFLASKNLDITQLDLEDNSYDLIVCYHVLEHVEKDRQAMQELYRVLKPSGSCFIQTPFKEGDIYENSAITGEKERKEHFGQEDHVRIYSVAGLKQRLVSAGFHVKQLDFSEKQDNYYGFRETETVLVATK